MLPARQRIQSIDILRGIIMVIMALDHTRDFFHVAAMTDQPTNMATTTPALFFTRWITHFCAPVFVFLAGTAAFLNGQKNSTKELSRYLLTRGAWLIVIEVVVMSFVLSFNPLYNGIFLIILWATGISMILLSMLIYLPYRVLLTIGLVIFFAHNLLDYPEAAKAGQLNVAWSILHGRGTMIPINANHFLLIGYSFLSWTGIMILGYCTGILFSVSTSAATRKKRLWQLGTGLLLLFFAGRLTNQYGDPVPWATQRDSVTTLLSFFNLNKYPPSLLFCCMTLGPALITLAFIENMQNKLTAFFMVYGRVPLFYYVIHFFFIHLLCTIIFFASGHSMANAFDPKGIFGFRPVQFGYPLGIVYIIWLGIVLLMYPLCRMYNRYKSTHRQWWLTYL